MFTPAVTKRDTPIVKVIKATKPIYGNTNGVGKFRVCAYGRVSTDSEEQKTSIKSQKSYFIDKIKSNPEWEFAGYFEDDGVSGKSVEKRKGLKELIQHCKQGNVDKVLMKAVSRFSRNVVDGLMVNRELKKYGVEVIFDQNGFGTFDQNAEMQLAIHTMLAQDEIERQSKSVIFGKTEQIRKGNVSYQYKYWFGYEKGPNGKPQIVPHEAQTISSIYASYLAGESLKMIADNLNSKGIYTKQGSRWTKNTISKMLSDHKNCGNFFYGKTFKESPLDFESKRNTGQRPQFLVIGAHNGIVTEETWNLTQAEMKRRNDIKLDVDGESKPSRFSAKYALSEKLRCECCGAGMLRKTWQWKDGEKRPVWKCATTDKKHNTTCFAKVVDEYRIHDAILKVLNAHTEETESTLAMVSKNIATACENNSDSSPQSILSEINLLEKALSELITLSVKSRQIDLFEEKFKDLSKQISEKKKQYDNMEEMEKAQAELSERIHRLQDFILKTPEHISEYDDTLTRQTIKSIGIIDENHLRITLIDGTEIIQTMMDRLR